MLFAILQMYEFSSKSQPFWICLVMVVRCLRYCKCTSFQANHNLSPVFTYNKWVVCDTANVRVFKQITTSLAIQSTKPRCLRYCKCTSFQANHNVPVESALRALVVCDTANVRVFKQITTAQSMAIGKASCLRYCKCTSFQANHNL